MVTLQDISVQLMKPAKDLADWKFPLSQILEEYYALLDEPCNVNFGEAALVLQNSTNVYVRRVELLCDETEVLKQTFFGYQEEKQKSTLKTKKISKSSYIDVENFVIIDLENSIGKNINKRSPFQEQKKVKLLSHRFTQLEHNITPVCIPFQMYDILGEIIGRKYDFRCNQAVNMNGMLVDELTPFDFTHMPSSRVQKGRHSLSLYSEPKTPVTGTSGYHSATSPNPHEFMTPIHEGFEDEQNLSLHIDNDSLLNESDIKDKEDVINGNEETLPTNVNSLNETSIEKDSLNEQSTKQNVVQDSLIISDPCVLNQDSSYREINKEGENTNSRTNLSENECQSSDNDIELTEANNQITSNSKKLVQNNKLSNMLCKEGLLGLRKRGNETKKMSICTVDDINESDWKPMSLDQGTNNVLPRNSSVLKIPKYISLLETKFSAKKRKLTSNVRKSECLTKFVLRETGSSLKDSPVSPRKQMFKRLQKQELKDFIKDLDQCLNNTGKDHNSWKYEAVTHVSADLLGFRVSDNENRLTENHLTENRLTENSFEDVSRSPSQNGITSRSITRNNSLDSEESSNICNDWLEPPSSDMNSPYSLPDYQTLIEGKMKEIFEESEVGTELEQTVAKWHASLQQKLSRAEGRSAFRIHDYASHIIRTLRSLDQKKINFDSVVQDKPACEVARYFLASLQLANTYNVELRTENSSSSMELVLLDNEKNYDDC